MESRVDAFVLWARALLVGGFAFGLGVTGHVTAEGLLPSPVVMVALLGFSVLLSVPLLSRPASSARIVATLVTGQSLIHIVLAATAGHRGDSTSTIAAARPPGVASLRELPVVGGHRVGSLQDAYQSMSGNQTPLAPTLPLGHLINDLSTNAPMMAAHVAAAVLVGLWLGYGERCLWTVLALTGRRVFAAVWALTPVATPPPADLAAAAHIRPLLPVLRWQARPHSRRGPPVLAA